MSELNLEATYEPLEIPVSHANFDLANLTKSGLVKACSYLAEMAKNDPALFETQSERILQSAKEGAAMQQKGMDSETIKSRQWNAMSERHKTKTKIEQKPEPVEPVHVRELATKAELPVPIQRDEVIQQQQLATLQEEIPATYSQAIEDVIEHEVAAQQLDATHDIKVAETHIAEAAIVLPEAWPNQQELPHKTASVRTVSVQSEIANEVEEATAVMDSEVVSVPVPAPAIVTAPIEVPEVAVSVEKAETEQPMITILPEAVQVQLEEVIQAPELEQEVVEEIGVLQTQIEEVVAELKVLLEEVGLDAPRVELVKEVLQETYEALMTLAELIDVEAPEEFVKRITAEIIAALPEETLSNTAEQAFEEGTHEQKHADGVLAMARQLTEDAEDMIQSWKYGRLAVASRLAS